MAPELEATDAITARAPLLGLAIIKTARNKLAIDKISLGSVSSAVVIATSAIAILAVAYLAWIRVRYPYELEWLESGMVEHVRRLLEGKQIYTRPNVNFVTFPYGPVSTVVGAAISWPFGAGFWELRLISALSSFGTFALLALLVKHETNRWTPAIAAAGIYAAAFRICGAWYDVAKPDALFLFLCFAAIAFVRFASRPDGTLATRRIIYAGTLLGLAILTKQTAILVFFALAVYLCAVNWRRAIPYMAATAITVLVISAIFSIHAGRWYVFFVWDLLQEHQAAELTWWSVITNDLAAFWPALLLIIANIRTYTTKNIRSASVLYLLTGTALFAGAWISRLHAGGYNNVLMPAVAVIALFTGLSAGRLLADHKKTVQVVAVCAVLVLQLWYLRYDVSAQIPTKAQKSNIANAIRSIHAVNGDVLVLLHPTYGVSAGKQSHASLGGIADVFRGTDKAAESELHASIDSAVHSGRFAAIVLDSDDNQDVLPADWQNYYEKSPTSLITDHAALKPVTGWMGPPTELWLRRTHP